DRAALAEMTRSFAGLFGTALRIYSSTGALLADAEKMPRLYGDLDKSKVGRKAVQELITVVRRATPEGKEPLVVPCVSGGRYLISSIQYEGRFLGRVILGPY